MIRTIGVFLFLVIYAVISLPVYLIVNIIGHFHSEKKAIVSQSFVVWGFNCVLKISGTHIQTTGLENVPKDTAVLYVGNHRSYFDIVTCYTLVKNNTGFVAKKEMEHVPCISRWMKYIHCQFLDRDNIKEGLKTILECIRLIKAGTSIFIFPEGTRNQSDEMLPFKAGSFKIATKAKCPIIPVAIYNTENIFETHMPFIKKQTVSIRFGTPIYPDALSPEDKKNLNELVQNRIYAMLKEN